MGISLSVYENALLCKSMLFPCSVFCLRPLLDPFCYGRKCLHSGHQCIHLGVYAYIQGASHCGQDVHDQAQEVDEIQVSPGHLETGHYKLLA